MEQDVAQEENAVVQEGIMIQEANAGRPAEEIEDIQSPDASEDGDHQDDIGEEVEMAETQSPDLSEAGSDDEGSKEDSDDDDNEESETEEEEEAEPQDGERIVITTYTVYRQDGTILTQEERIEMGGVVVVAPR